MKDIYKPEFRFDPETASYNLLGPSQGDVTATLIAAFYKDVEGKITQALIDLGWTPPPNHGSKPPRD